LYWYLIDIMTATLNFKEFFVELGKLLYAISLADGKVQEEEVIKVNELIKNELIELSKQTDEFDTNSAFYTAFSFETNFDRSTDIEEALASFLDYLTKNKSFLSNDLLDICLSCVKKVAETVNGIEESEQKVISQLVIDINKIFS